MKHLIVVVFALALISGLRAPVRADDAQDAKAIVDKGIKALGGEEALGKLSTAYWKSKTKTTINGSESEGTSQMTVQGLDHCRQEFEGEFNGNKFKGVFLLDGDKGVRKFGDNRADLDKDGVIEQKRVVYLTVIPVTLLPLKSKDFKLETLAEEKIDDKPAVGIKVTGPEGKDFKIYFDKESGLPVRTVAKIRGFQGDQVTQETTYSDYKEMAGIKKATKVVARRNGDKFQEQQITEFKPLEKVESKVFTEVD